MPVSDALSHVDVAQIAKWQDELRQMQAESQDEEAEAGDSKEKEGQAKQERTAVFKSSRSAALKATGGVRFLDVRAGLVVWLSTVVADAVQTRMHKLPKTSAGPRALGGIGLRPCSCEGMLGRDGGQARGCQACHRHDGLHGGRLPVRVDLGRATAIRFLGAVCSQMHLRCSP